VGLEIPGEKIEEGTAEKIEKTAAQVPICYVVKSMKTPSGSILTVQLISRRGFHLIPPL